jgi:DNA-binding NarL/FixJ family response regulator
MAGHVRKLRILIADNHPLIRRGERGLLQAKHGWRVVGEAENGRQAVEKAKKLKPDIAIVNICMPDLDGIQVTRQIREAVPDTKVLILTLLESDEIVRDALEAGVRGYVLKSDVESWLVKAVKGVSTGGLFLTPRVSAILLEGFVKGLDRTDRAAGPHGRPTQRQVEIIKLLAKGKANKQIAAALGISTRTVETHRANIMLKLGLHSLTELIHFAIRNRIVAT